MLYAKLILGNQKPFWLELPTSEINQMQKIAEAVCLGWQLAGQGKAQGKAQCIDTRLSKHKTELTLTYAEARKLFGTAETEEEEEKP